MKKLFHITLGVVLGALLTIPVGAQGSLSNQVLRLLTRINTWTALQTFDTPNGGELKLSRQTVALGTETDRLENIGGNLYFNGVVLAASTSAGTVTSVGLSLPAIFSVASSPVTSTGVIAVTLATETANRVWAGPTTGSPATPTFRALVAADVPDVSATYLTPAGAAALTNKTGNISQWTNNSGYILNTQTTLSSLTSIGTIGTGVWQGTVVAGQYGGTGVANTSKTITLGGNLTTSGANNITFTTTASTSVTLPTSGTLATTTATAFSSLVSIGTVTTGVWNATVIGVAYGGTGLASYTQGDLLYASAGTTISKLAKSATATRYLANTGTTNNPAWAQVDLTNGVTGVLPAANGGLATSIAAVTDGQLLIGKTSDHTLNLAAITGTSNQITVTNGGGSITLSTPQSIATASTPQFARLGLGTGAGGSALLTGAGQLDLGFVNDGSCGAADTIDWNGGEAHKSTLSAATCTYTFSNPISGRTYVLHVIQDGTGGRLVTWPGTVTWKGGAAPTLTATINKTDICYFRWNGTAYLSDCDLNY